MCGIAGFVNFEGHDKTTAADRVRMMADVIAHRGPDAGGYYVDQRVALGHRRLSIIDVTHGQQPMSVRDGRVQIIYNGEVYNFQELRAELELAGYRFQTNSDTEVVLWAYCEWGASCVTRFNGMFALAIWDRDKQQLFLARDRVGKKPIYFVEDGSTFAFASELKALRAGKFTTGGLDNKALDCYLTMGYVPSPMTIYSSVRKLRPAHSMTITAAGVRQERYWNLSFPEPRDFTLAEAKEEFEPLFQNAVDIRLVSEVPLGAFLSGGIDSSLVVSAMAKSLDRPVKTHTIDFDDSSYSEKHVAKAIAEHLGTEHHEFTVQPNAADVLEKIAWHFDEPFADSSALPTWYVCEMTRKSVTVALSGDGGDEGFGGYTFRYLPHVFESAWRRRLPPALRTLIFSPLGAVWPASARLPRALRLKSILQNLATSDSRAFFRDMTWLQEDARASIYRQEFSESLKGFTPLETVAPYYAGCDSGDALARSQYTDVNVYMTDDVLVKVDRMSMAHSLEVRAPLLDYRVLEFAARLPREHKLRLREGKVLLRTMAADRLPEKVRSMPKRGFSIPAAEWLRTDLRGIVEDVVLNRHGLIMEKLNADGVRSMWRQHQQGQRDHSVFLWGLMMLALWENSTKSDSV
jgi:asparagine synthase (glutamine-hydrolysing)